MDNCIDDICRNCQRDCQRSLDNCLRECCEAILDIFLKLLLAALLATVVLVFAVCGLVGLVLRLWGMHDTLIYMLLAMVPLVAAMVFLPSIWDIYAQSSGSRLRFCRLPCPQGSACHSCGRLVTYCGELLHHRSKAAWVISTWALSKVGSRIPAMTLALFCWVAAAVLARRSLDAMAYIFLVFSVVLTLAALAARANCDERPARTEIAEVVPAAMHQGLLSPAPVPIVPIAELWECFFAACLEAGGELLARPAADGRAWLTKIEVEELGPQLLVGLSAVVLTRTMLRGAASVNQFSDSDLLLCSKNKLTRASIPSGSASQNAFTYMLEGQAEMRQAKVRYEDLPVIDGLALWEGELDGVTRLYSGDVVSTKELVRVKRNVFSISMFSTILPSGSQGVVLNRQSSRDEVRVRWPEGEALVEAPKLQKMGGDRPKPLEAFPYSIDEARLKKLRYAVGRARTVALTISAMPEFSRYFHRRVLSPLLEEAQPLLPPLELQRTGSGGIAWRRMNDIDSLATGLAMEVGRSYVF